MRRVSQIIFFIIVILLSGCSSREELKYIFDNYEIETVENIPYVYFDTLIYDNHIMHFREILEENNYNGKFHEVYVIQDNTIWFGFSDAERNKNNSLNWNIASVNTDSKEVNICYSGEFCLDMKADKGYVQSNNNSATDDFQSDNGFYHEGKIVLTDHVKVVEFDLETGNSSEFTEIIYEYPTSTIKAEIIDYNKISFFTENKQKVFDVKQGKKTSNVFKKLYELESKKTWKGTSYLSELFNKVQIINNQIYITCRVFNWDGETHAIVFQYDFENNSCNYAFHCFMDDIIGNNLYVVPLI